MSRQYCQSLLLVFFLVVSGQGIGFADTLPTHCQGHFVNPITDIDWEAIFPITIGHNEVVAGELPDTPNPESPVCLCPSDKVGMQVGLSLGFWEPFALADVTPNPWCMVNMGFEMNVTSVGHGSASPPADDAGRGSFYEVHWYKYPVIYWLQVITSMACMEMGEMDVAYLSELDPAWNDDELAFVINPESILFANPIALASCAADATASLINKPINALFWCMGTQGDVYPMDGNIAFQKSPLQAALLAMERMDYKLHREGLILDSVGKDAPALCYQYPSVFLPKTRYRYQLVNVVPDADQAFAFGHDVMSWEAGHMPPQAGDNYGFLIFRKRNCCFL